MADFLSEAEARDLCDLILAQSTSDGAEVNLSSVATGNTRFARNGITTSGDVIVDRATVTARVGRRSASVTWNDLGTAAIQRAVARAEELAVLAPEDPETMPLLGQQTYEQVGAFFQSTEGLDAARRADAVLAVVEPAEAAHLVATGFLQGAAGSTAVANTAGLFAYHRSTLASYSITVRTAEGTGSGWTGAVHNEWLQMTSPRDLAAAAIGKARRSIDAQPIEPGHYTVVLEPTAVGNLVQIIESELDARAADEGRSFFSRRGGGNSIGDAVIDERLTLFSDPVDPDLLTRPFTRQGVPLRRTLWIDTGILSNLAYDGFWAAEQGREPTLRGGGIKLTGGRGTTDDLVKTVERGLLVTRFWYIRPVDRPTLTYTGLTRDGTFLIENGQVTQPVRNLRFIESPISMLGRVEEVGSSQRVVASESGGGGSPVAVPALVIRDFHFTSVSEAV
jgi:predicted Zn-dependent protease